MVRLYLTFSKREAYSMRNMLTIIIDEDNKGIEETLEILKEKLS